MNLKTAEQWQEELAGETSLESIREIQADAVAAHREFIARKIYQDDCRASQCLAKVWFHLDEDRKVTLRESADFAVQRAIDTNYEF